MLRTIHIDLDANSEGEDETDVDVDEDVDEVKPNVHQLAGPSKCDAVVEPMATQTTNKWAKIYDIVLPKNEAKDCVQPVASTSAQPQSDIPIAIDRTDQSTDSRYLYFSSDPRHADPETGLTPRDSYIKSSNPNLEYKLKPRWMCRLCDDRVFNRREKWLLHKHVRHDKFVQFVKYNQLVVHKVRKHSKKEEKAKKKLKNDKRHKARDGQHDKRKRKPKTHHKPSKRKQRADNESLVSPSITEEPSSATNTTKKSVQNTIQCSAPLSTVSSNGVQYKVLQKCKVCTYTPIFNSVFMVREHITSDHNIHIDVDKYHSSVMFKVKT